MDDNELMKLKEIEGRLSEIAEQIEQLNLIIRGLRDELDRQRMPRTQEK